MVGFLASLVAFLASVAAVVLRWRRSRGQQLKWLVYTFAVTIIAGLCAVASWYMQDDIPGAWSSRQSLPAW
jgi:hypothetical protein